MAQNNWSYDELFAKNATFGGNILTYFPKSDLLVQYEKGKTIYKKE